MTLKTTLRAVMAAMLLVAVVDSESKSAPLPELSDDGWHSSRVEEIDNDSYRFEALTAWRMANSLRY